MHYRGKDSFPVGCGRDWRECLSGVQTSLWGAPVSESRTRMFHLPWVALLSNRKPLHWLTSCPCSWNFYFLESHLSFICSYFRLFRYSLCVVSRTPSPASQRAAACFCPLVMWLMSPPVLCAGSSVYAHLTVSSLRSWLRCDSSLPFCTEPGT